MAKNTKKVSDAAAIRIMLSTTTIISTLGIGLWEWIQLKRSLLPTPDSRAGEKMLDRYQILTYGIWLALLLVAACYLINRIYIYQQDELPRHQYRGNKMIPSFLYFIQKNPITSIIFIAYTVAMISGTTYLYRDMIGWYPELIQGHFLDNFSLRGSFVNETLRRTDYRFFPLGHQDLHILS